MRKVINSNFELIFFNRVKLVYKFIFIGLIKLIINYVKFQ